MAAKGDIVSTETIKPSTPTPDHLRYFKISLLDQLIPHQLYIPLVLCYSHHDINNAFGTTSDDHFTMISHKLKTSLSHLLTLYYPFCGTTLKDNLLVECNDTGVIFIESKVPANLSDILINPLLYDDMKEFLPFDPYNFEEPVVNMAVKLNHFSCGAIALGVCFSHKLADGATAASLLNAWALISKGQGSIVAAPQMDAANLHFPPRNIEMSSFRDMVSREDIVTKRFIFNGTNISRLRDKFGSFNPSRVEAVTALIWKSALEAAAAKASSEEQIIHASMVSHVVSIRSRVVPPLPKDTRGNLWLQALSPSVEVKGEVGLHDLAEMVRKAVKRIDADYVSKLQGDGLLKAIECLKEEMRVSSEKGIPVYVFSSVARLDYYENDFGWGKPTWVSTVGMRPVKNAVLFMPTRDGDGIEAWVTLSKRDMVEFERNPELLNFTSFDY